jgi:hypothetical protein
MAVLSEVSVELSDNQVVGYGIEGSTVAVQLAPGQETVAARLLRQFGRQVALSVGDTNFCGRAGRSGVCSALPPPVGLAPGLHLDLRLARSTVRSGRSGKGKLVITNAGPGTFNVDTGQPLVGFVLHPGTRRVVATSVFAVGGTGFDARMRPKTTVSVPVVFGTGRCDGGVGSALPAGRYDVAVFISVSGTRPLAHRSAGETQAPLRVVG